MSPHFSGKIWTNALDPFGCSRCSKSSWLPVQLCSLSDRNIEKRKKKQSSQHSYSKLGENILRKGIEVVAVRTERTKTTEGQYSPVRLELARFVSSLLYGTRAMFFFNFPAFENKKYTAYDRFQGNGPYGEIPTKKEPIRTLGFALPYNKGD